jgi:alpha-glucuronidase
MGYIKHDAIIVTSWDEKLIDKAHEFAKNTGNNVTNIVGPLSNGYCTFTIVPDGSKEGWAHSHEGDAAREKFLTWANEQRYEDNSSSLEWVHISYGSDDAKVTVVNNTWSTHE